MRDSVGQREAVGVGAVDGLTLVARRPAQLEYRAVQGLTVDNSRQQVGADGDLREPARSLWQDDAPQVRAARVAVVGALVEEGAEGLVEVQERGAVSDQQDVAGLERIGVPVDGPLGARPRRGHPVPLLLAAQPRGGGAGGGGPGATTWRPWISWSSPRSSAATVGPGQPGRKAATATERVRPGRSRCPPPSSRMLSATTTRPPAASATRPAEPGADTPQVITQGHQRAGFLGEPATVEFESPPVNQGGKMA